MLVKLGLELELELQLCPCRCPVGPDQPVTHTWMDGFTNKNDHCNIWNIKGEYFTVLHYTALHCSTLHWPAVHCTVLHSWIDEWTDS
jgi:hypothetical protein